MYGGHVVEYLPGKESVFGTGYQGLHLCWGAGKKYGEIALFHFAVFPVGAAVVGKAVVVEGLAHGVAPVAVLRSYGGGDGVGLIFAYQAGAVRIHQVLQDTRSGVVAGDEEHLVGRDYGRLGLCTFFAQCLVLCFFAAIGCHTFGHLFADFIVEGFYQQAYQREHAFA